MEKQRVIIKEKKAKMNSLTKFVVFSLASILIFTIVMIVLYCNYQAVPDTLITCFFSCLGGECLFACIIQCFKIKENRDE